MNRCSACKAALVWALTPTGAKAPVEEAVEPGGNVLMLRPAGLDAPLAVVLSQAALEHARERGVPLHFNHFARCPEKEKFQRE